MVLRASRPAATPEWVESCALAERKASRWRKEPSVDAIEILEARQVSTMAVNEQMFGGE